MNIGPDDLQFAKKAGAAETGNSRDGASSADPVLEAALRQALRPVEAPDGFADRLVARALAGEAPRTLAVALPSRTVLAPAKLLHWPQSRLWITGAVAAGLLAGVLEGGVAWHHMREQQQRVVEATRQFQTTERVTVRALAQAREQLQRAGVPLSLD